MNWFLDLFGSYDNPEFQKPCLNGFDDLPKHGPSWVDTGDITGYKWCRVNPDIGILEGTEEPNGYPMHIVMQNKGISQYVVTASYMVTDKLRPYITFHLSKNKVIGAACIFWLTNHTMRHRIELDQPDNMNIGIFHPRFYKNDMALMAASNALRTNDIEGLENIIKDSP